MFKKLRNEFIFINLLLVSAVLIIAFITIYAVTIQLLEQQSEIILHGMAVDADTRLPQEGVDEGPQNPINTIIGKVFYTRISPDGKIIEYSHFGTYDSVFMETITLKTMLAESNRGVVSEGSYQFRYVKVAHGSDALILFFDTSMQEKTLQQILYALLVIASASIVVVFLISRYLSNKAIKPIKDTWEKQNTFIADVSHELRTPLAVVKSNLEIIIEQMAELNPTQGKWLLNVDKEINRMSKLVDELLFLERVNSQSEQLTMDEVNISTLIECVLDVFRPLVAKKFLQLESSIQKDCIIFGNEGRLKQLITILMDNAINYSNEGGLIDIKLTFNENICEILMKDNGIGIPEEALPKIYDRFYRVDKSRARNAGGTGLGLSIADCIIKEHRGKILVNSELGNGTEFKVLIPMNGKLGNMKKKV